MSQARNELRMRRRYLEKENQKQPTELRMMPREDWNKFDHSTSTLSAQRIEVWRSYKHLVQVFQEKDGLLRMSVNRARIGRGGDWDDGLHWEELQDIKRQIGRGHMYAIEIFPAALDVVNVANMRHLWILPEPLDIGWFNRSL